MSNLIITRQRLIEAFRQLSEEGQLRLVDLANDMVKSEIRQKQREKNV